MSFRKKIAAHSTLLVIYALAIGLAYSTQFHSVVQKSESVVLNQVDDSRDHFNHTVPFDYTLNVRVRTSSQPFPTHESQIGILYWSHSIYNGLSNKQLLNMLNLLIERKKVNLLYPFYFFF